MAAKAIYASRTWQALRRLVKMNPSELSESDIYRNGFYRSPAPGSQGGANFDKSDPHPPAYKQPVTAASNLSKSYYFNRDQRRKDLGFPEVFAGDSAKALPAPAAATAATAAPVVEGPPVPGRPFEWKNSQVSDYATKYL